MLMRPAQIFLSCMILMPAPGEYTSRVRPRRRRIQNGWELRGKAAADLYWNWNSDKSPTWSGRADVSQASLQVVGLNQPVLIEDLRAEWRDTERKFTLGKISAFGADWAGFVAQP